MRAISTECMHRLPAQRTSTTHLAMSKSIRKYIISLLLLVGICIPILLLISEYKYGTVQKQSARKVLCLTYKELRHTDFQHPKLTKVLCSNADAYKQASDGYPLCKLPNPFYKPMMQLIRDGSDTAELRDTENKTVKMFIYPQKDLISEEIRQHHQWETSLVKATLQFAKRVPNATFLDIGSNIGVYSVLAARLGLPVVSLDANIRNLLRLRLTLDAASLDAQLVWNFIGSGGELSYLNFPGDCNVGGATKFGRAVRDTVPVMPVQSDRLCRLINTKNIVIKMDVEGGEADFLRTSGRLFSDFRVAAVQMEWLQRHMVGSDRSTILEFFTSRRYSAWKTPDLKELDTKAASSWDDGDIMWVHKDFRDVVMNFRKTAK